MIDRIVLNDPVIVNYLGLECECLDSCGRLFAYIEAYIVASDWIDEHGKDGYEYYIIVQGCDTPRHDIVAYVDYKGTILASVYAEKEEG